MTENKDTISDKDFLKKIGSNIKAIRKQRKISLMTVQEAGVTDISNMSRTESGLVNPHILTLKKLATLYDVDIKEFLYL